MSEDKFPTIRDIRDVLNSLINEGLSDLPAQIVIVPDSTLQAIARVVGRVCEKPALMIEFAGASDRLPVLIYTTDRQNGREMKSLISQ